MARDEASLERLKAEYRKAERRLLKATETSQRASRARARAIWAMHDAGMSYGAIAAVTYLSRSRIQQICEETSAGEI